MLHALGIDIFASACRLLCDTMKSALSQGTHCDGRFFCFSLRAASVHAPRIGNLRHPQINLVSVARGGNMLASGVRATRLSIGVIIQTNRCESTRDDRCGYFAGDPTSPDSLQHCYRSSSCTTYSNPNTTIEGGGRDMIVGFAPGVGPSLLPFPCYTSVRF